MANLWNATKDSSICVVTKEDHNLGKWNICNGCGIKICYRCCGEFEAGPKWGHKARWFWCSPCFQYKCKQEKILDRDEYIKKFYPDAIDEFK
jgi:hypothetical protein